MAKHCDICNQDYADDLPTCPHCAAAKTTRLASRQGPDRTTQLADVEAAGEPISSQHIIRVGGDSDSAIDLGQGPTVRPATGDAGGAEPASLGGAAEQASPVGEQAEQQIHEPTGPATMPMGEEAEVIDLAESPPQTAAHRVSDSEVDLGASPVEIVEEGSGVAQGQKPAGESEVFMAELASDASQVELVREADSGADLSGLRHPAVEEPAAEVVEAVVDEQSPEAELVEEVALDASEVKEDSSAVDLGAAPEEPVEVVEAVEVEEAAEVGSGIDLHDLPVPAPSAADVRAASDSFVDLGSQHELPADEAAAAEVGEGSGIDVHPTPDVPPSASEVRAATESMIDLGGQPEAAKAGESGVSAGSQSGSGSGISDIALESLLSEESGVRPPAGESGVTAASEEEPVVSEEEVNDLLANLEQTPGTEEAREMVSGETAAEVAEGEQAIAAAEAEEAAESAAAEEAAEEPETDEEKPAKAARPRSRVPALVGGTFLGFLLGAGGLLGARLGGFDLAAMMGLASDSKPANRSGIAQTQTQTQAPGMTAGQRAAMLKNGDFEEAEKAGIDSVQEGNADQLAERGEIRLGSYLKKVGGAKFNPQDPALQPAIDDLKKAADLKNPDALYDLGLINELGGKFQEASAEYNKGIQVFTNDPMQKRRFQSALQRVEWKAANKAAGAAWLPQHPADRAALLALLLVGLQQPQDPQQPQQPQQQPQPQQPQQQPQQPQQQQQQPGEIEEAGYEFWDASKLAREGKFAEAIRAIDKAKKLHDQRRFTRLRKAQNPLSDPTEDIFLRCCDELKEYWRLQDRLRGGGYLTEKNTPVQALDRVFQAAQAGEGTVKDITDKLIAEKVIAKGDDVSKGINGLITQKKEADAKIEELNGKVKKATDEAATLAGKLKTAEDTIKDREAKLKTAEQAQAKLKSANQELKDSIERIGKELADAKLVDPSGKVDVREAIKKVVDIAKIKDPNGEIRKQRDMIARLESSLMQRWRPEDMLPLWRLLLEQNRTRTELANKAVQDAERVKADPFTSAAQKGQAGVVQGLALRNREQFAESKAALETARMAVDRGDWIATADAALREVSAPAAYYAQWARQLADRGRLEDAVGVLTRAQKVVPASGQGKLFAERSLLELDAARSRAVGTLPAGDPLVAAARQDAAAAVKAGLAEGHYASGRIAEALGDWDTAIKSYRQALAAHPARDAEGSRYRVALARVLLQPRDVRPGQPVPAPMPAPNKVGWHDPAPYPARHLHDLKQVAWMMLLGLQPPLLPGEEPGLEEAEKLADEVLAAPPDTVPFHIRAQALAIKGRWTPALELYIEGIRPYVPREYMNGLLYLIRNHPRLKRPDSLLIPNPLEAEKHFAAGLNFYFDGDFANAERSFLLTIENDPNDARYFYFLGLARLAQNRRRDAYADFAQGAELERVNRPAPAAVSETLERVQGPARCIVNEFRNRPEPEPREVPLNKK